MKVEEFAWIADTIRPASIVSIAKKVITGPKMSANSILDHVCLVNVMASKAP